MAAGLGLPGLEDEMAVMEAGLQRAFDLGDPVSEVSREDLGNPYLRLDGSRMWSGRVSRCRSFIAPTSRPEFLAPTRRTRRPTGADSCAHIGSGDSILLVTSSIYPPYQHAVRGADAGSSSRVLARDGGRQPRRSRARRAGEVFKPFLYLQETKSQRLRSTRELYYAAKGMVGEA